MASKEQLENRIDELEEKMERLKKESFTFPLQKKQKDALKNELKKGIEIESEKFLEVGPALFMGANFNVNDSNEVNAAYILSGNDRSRSVGETDNTQLTLSNFPTTTGSTNQSFFYGFRPPLYTNDGVSVTSGESTLTDTKFNWDTNELAGAYIDVRDTNLAFKETYQISSNTATEITIDGSWTFTDSDVTYIVFMPVYLGSADYPYRRVYAGEDIRLGFGPSGGSQPIFIKHGTGTPEGNVSANVGSLFLRKDGGSGTTLYVKESGTGNTGWSSVS